MNEEQAKAAQTEVPRSGVLAGHHRTRATLLLAGGGPLPTLARIAGYPRRSASRRVARPPATFAERAMNAMLAFRRKRL